MLKSYMFHAKEISVEESLSRSLEHCYTLIEGLPTNISRRHADCKTMSCESDQLRLFNRLSSKQRDHACLDFVSKSSSTFGCYGQMTLCQNSALNFSDAYKSHRCFFFM